MRSLSEVEVALRKESVDRNCVSTKIDTGNSTSLSARRAWIEIRRRTYQQGEGQVALRKESVDRNNVRKVIVSIGP